MATLTIAEFLEKAPMDSAAAFNIHGVSLEIPKSILTPEILRAFAGGYYEGSEIGALRRVVRKGDVVLEIGAGIGFISTFLLTSLGAGRVVAVEANPDLLPTIHRTHQLNNVSAAVIHGVAGRSNQPVMFYRQAAFWGSSVVPLPDSQLVSLPGIDTARLVRETRPDVLVVDIEGGEQDFFVDLDLPGVRSLVVEVHQPTIGGAGIARCFSALQAAGFAYDPDGSGGTNVVFTRV